MNKSPAFRFYPADFIMGTLGFTAEQTGAYIRLLCIAWDRGGVPDDIALCASLAGVSPEVLGLVWVKFGLAEHGLRKNARLELEREKQEVFAAKQVLNGRKGGRPPQTKPTDNPPPPQTKPTDNPPPPQTKPTDNPPLCQNNPKQSLSFSSSLSVVPPTPLGEESEDADSSSGSGKKKSGKRRAACWLAAEWADEIGGLFGRPAGRATSIMLERLKDHALRGLLPPDPVKWASLKRMIAAAKKNGAAAEDFELRCRWLKSAEAMAEALPEACDRAEAWVQANFGAATAAEKKNAAGEPEPAGWRPWLAKAFPKAVAPGSFWELPADLRAEFSGRAEA